MNILKKFVVFAALTMLLLCIASCSEKNGIAPDTSSDPPVWESDSDITAAEELETVTTETSVSFPTEGAAQLLPVPDFGEVSETVAGESSCVAVIANVNSHDYERYLEAVKIQGFTENASQTDFIDSRYYYADKGGATVMLSFEGDALTIKLAILY